MDMEVDEGKALGSVALQMVGTCVNSSTTGGQSRLLVGPVDLRIAKGETVVLVGPSGAGKSTILHLIAGIVTPNEGSVAFEAQTSGKKVRIGFSPQAPALLPWLSLLDNVLMPTRLGSTPSMGPEASHRARELLTRFGLAGTEHARPNALSGGMRSRAALARALIGEPNLLLLDEPFGSLDDVTAERILLDLSPHLDGNQRTTIMVSHNLIQAVFLADRVAILSPGPGIIIGEVEVCAPHPRGLSFFDAPELERAVAETRSILRGARR
jgi:NitT/TauT family transport system ATP-binding protein